MTVKDIANIIFNTEYLFEVSIPSVKFLSGKIDFKEYLINKKGIEDCLIDMARSNNVEEVEISLHTLNGKTPLQYRNKGNYTVSLPKDELILNSPLVKDESVLNATLTKDEPNLNHKLEINVPENAQKHTTMQDKDYINYKVLEVEHNTLTRDYKKSEEKIVKLEKKVEDLHEENKTLLRDNSTKEDKHTIALERQKFDAERSQLESKESLSGLAGDLLKDPEMIKREYKVNCVNRIL